MRTELEARGGEDLLFAGVDGVVGFEDANGVGFPHPRTEQCLVHLVHQRPRYVQAKHRKAVAVAKAA